MFVYDVEGDGLDARGVSLNAARRLAVHPVVVTVRCLLCGWESAGHVRVSLAQDAKRGHAPRCGGR
jgi:hypothetical protein